MGNPIVHFEFMGPDGDAQKEFYSNIFDWKLTAVEGYGGYFLTETGEGQLAGAIGQGSEEMSHYVTVYVQVDGIDATLEKIEEAGGKTLLPRTEIPDMVTYALFSDPAGNMVGLVEG
jgi:predicted enzyme related to lactoylglutathione lyase